MAAVASIQSESRNLGSSSKRHNNELVQSANKSLSILEAASQSYEEDQHAIYSLRKYEDFITPFISACSEASAKSCASALQCIQTLATFKGIAPRRSNDLLKALMEATQLGLGIQLKILQVLPVISHEFANDLSGREVIESIRVCAVLLEGNKVAMVHNAAYATLQQSITGVFDRTENDALTDWSADERNTCQVKVNESISFDVSPTLGDSLMVLLDLCNFAEKIAPKFLKIKELSLTFTLELIELTLSNQVESIHRHKEFAAILRCRVTTLLLRLFSEASDFSIILRVVRIFYLLLRQHLSILTTESEVVSSTLAQGARQSILWKRILCLEVLQGVLMEVSLLYEIFEKFDAEEGRTNIIAKLTSLFADALSDGHGLMSATELNATNFEPSLDKTSNAGYGDATTDQDTGPIVLSKFCAPSIPLIEMLDRTDPPTVTPQYGYLLIIKSANSMTDDVHKLVSTEVKDSSEILISLSSPLLVCLSASMSIAMDIDLFRLVVRSVQRFAHAAGIIGRIELRDEFIRLLIQFCNLPEDKQAKPWAVSRCSSCVRALFNLGYALGNQLGKSWDLIVTVIYSLAQEIGVNEPSLDSLYGDGESEYRTINVALRKSLESTIHLSNQALICLIESLGSNESLFKFTLLKLVAIINATRFSYASSGCWHAYEKTLSIGVMNTKESTWAALVLNECALVIMETAVNEDMSPSELDESLGMVLHSVCGEVRAEDPSIKVLASENINTLSDKFGAKITQGWVYVFDYICEVPRSNNYDLMHSTFRTVELICSDFLDNLPYARVLNLALCLDEFARQKIDSNTSFTSTSSFWSVCDHLMNGNDAAEDINSETIHSEKDLMRVARCYDSPSKRFALWLFAVLKLATISGTVAQQQVRTSAIQIFLRLFNAHGSQLPDGVWTVSISLVFPAFSDVNDAATYDVLSESEESRMSLISGSTNVIIQFFSRSSHLTSFGYFLDQWMMFLKTSAQFSPKIALTVYKTLKNLLDVDKDQSISRKTIAQFWLSQNLRPTYSEQHAKATADALAEFVNLYQYIKEVVDASESLKILTSCAMFPYYSTPTVSDNPYQMSNLQRLATKQLDGLKNFKNPTLITEILILLSNMSLSIVDTESSQYKPNFKGVSPWSLGKIIDVLDNVTDPPPKKVLESFPELLVAMTRLLSLEHELVAPSQIILRLLDMSTSLQSYDSEGIVESFHLVLANADYETERPMQLDENITALNATDRFVAILQRKDLPLGPWKQILRILMRYSILYERSIHNSRFYEQENFSAGQALQYGTVAPAVRIHRSEVSFFCSAKLQTLAVEEKSYSAFARKSFLLRTSCISNQYIGDCRVLGQEPLRYILHQELIFILQRLIKDARNPLIVDASIKHLVLVSLSRAHHDVLPLLQSIMISADK